MACTIAFTGLIALFCIESHALDAPLADGGSKQQATPQPLNTDAAEDELADRGHNAATDGDGVWVCVWTKTEGASDREVRLARSIDDGVSWTAPMLLFEGELRQNRFTPNVAADGNGTWIVTWVDRLPNGLGGMVWAVRSVDNGATWGAPYLVGDTAGDTLFTSNGASVASDGSGRWLVVWSDLQAAIGPGSEICNVYSSFSTDNGETWTDPEILSGTGPGDQGATKNDARAVYDGTGTWLVAWREIVFNTQPTQNRINIQVTRSTDHAATWSSPAYLNTDASTNFHRNYAPQMAADGRGNWVAVWGRRDENDIQLEQPLTAMVARSSDGGATWSAPAAVYEFTGSIEHLVYDGRITWAMAASSSLEPGASTAEDSDVYVMESSDAGATWSGPVPLNPDARVDDRYDAAPQIAPLTNMGWLVIWQARGGTGSPYGEDTDLFFTRFGTVVGDVDGNGAADSVDIQMVVNYVLGASGAGLCDVSKDGQVDAVDIQAVVNAVLAGG